MQSEIRVRGRASGSVFGADDVSLLADPAERLLCVAEGAVKPAGVGDRRQTELLQKSGKVYGYSRRVVGWSMQSRQTTDVALRALLKAVWRRKPKKKVLIHSDSHIIDASSPMV